MLKIATGEVFEFSYQEGAEPGKPYRVHLKFLTPSERDDALDILQKCKSGESTVSLVPILRMGVEKFENLSPEIDGKIVQIETVDDFLKYPLPHELYNESISRIMVKKGLEVDERKN